MIQRGTLWWADLGPAIGSRPATRRPVFVIQADSFNESTLATALVVVVTSNTDLAVMPGNVFLPAASTGLPRDSVANVTAVVTLNKSDLNDYVGTVPDSLLHEVDRGLRLVLHL